MNKPKTNKEAFDLVIETVGNPARLAKGLGLSRQLTSIWTEIPPPYGERVSALCKLPLDWILPELDAEISRLLGRPASPILADLIRILHPQPKASPWPRKTRKRKQSK